MKMFLLFFLLVTASSRQVDSLRPPVPATAPMVHAVAATFPSTSTATRCDSLSLANHMVRGCSDGRNVSDYCCSFVYSTLGRGLECFCKVQSQTIYRFSMLVRVGSMDALLRGCHADSYMFDLTRQSCPSHAAPTAPHIAPSPSPSALSEDVKPADAAPTTSPSRRVIKGKCSGHNTALVAGWVCAGVLLTTFLLTLVRSRTMARRCPWCRCRQVGIDETVQMIEMIDLRTAESISSNLSSQLNERNDAKKAPAGEESDPSVTLIMMCGDGSRTAASAVLVADVESDSTVPLIMKSSDASSSATDAVTPATSIAVADDEGESAPLMPKCADGLISAPTSTAFSATSVTSDDAAIIERDQRMRKPNPKYANADFLCSWPRIRQ